MNQIVKGILGRVAAKEETRKPAKYKLGDMIVGFFSRHKVLFWIIAGFYIGWPVFSLIMYLLGG